MNLLYSNAFNSSSFVMLCRSCVMTYPPNILFRTENTDSTTHRFPYPTLSLQYCKLPSCDITNTFLGWHLLTCQTSSFLSWLQEYCNYNTKRKNCPWNHVASVSAFVMVSWFDACCADDGRCSASCERSCAILSTMIFLEATVTPTYIQNHLDVVICPSNPSVLLYCNPNANHLGIGYYLHKRFREERNFLLFFYSSAAQVLYHIFWYTHLRWESHLFCMISRCIDAGHT